MTWNDALGNVSYLLIAVSYLVTHMLWLRILAMVGLVAEAVYFYAAGSGSLWVAIGWSVVFLVINGVQLLRLLRELRAAQLHGDERILKRGTFAALSLPSFRRLMKAGRWQTLAPGTLLTVQHTPVTHLRALARGRALVDVDGRPVAAVHPGGIVGEMSLLTGDAASATVCVTDEVRCFEVDGATLKQLLADHDDLRAQFHQALGTELAGKLLAQRSPVVALRA
jgi:hypothetical protein